MSAIVLKHKTSVNPSQINMAGRDFRVPQIGAIAGFDGSKMSSGPGMFGRDSTNNIGAGFSFEGASSGSRGTHFGFRLARLMIPKLSLAGLKVEKDTGTVYPTKVERKIKTVVSSAGSMTSKPIVYDDISEGIQFVNKEAVLNYVEDKSGNNDTSKPAKMVKRGGVQGHYKAVKDAGTVQQHVTKIQKAYQDAYKIQGANIMGPGMPLAVDDFVSPVKYAGTYEANVPFSSLGVETDKVRDMQEVINVIANANDANGVPKKENPILYADKVFALQKDAQMILGRQVPADDLSESIREFADDTKPNKLKDLVAVTQLTSLPPSKTAMADIYAGVKPLATNVDKTGRAQGKVQRVLKQMSVEILKTLVNEVKKKDGEVLPDSDEIEAISNDGTKLPIPNGKPAYKINDHEITRGKASTSKHSHDNITETGGYVSKVQSGDELRFFMRHLSEPRLRVDSKSYRYTVFEYENLMNKDAGFTDSSGNNDAYRVTNTFNGIAGMNASFLVSSLNAMRHYVVVIVCHDRLRRQHYYAKYCTLNTDVRDFVRLFDAAWSRDSLGQVQDFLYDTIMPSEGFRGEVQDVYNQVFRVLPSVEFNPFTQDYFNSQYREIQANVRDNILMNGRDENLRHGLQNALTIDNRGAVKFDIAKANLSDLQKFLQNLPRLKETPDTKRHSVSKGGDKVPFHKSGLWWDSGNHALTGIEGKTANLLSVPQVDREQTTIKHRLSHIEVDIDTKNIVPIMNPVVLQAMLFLKHLINDVDYTSLNDANNSTKRTTINEAMEDIFRSKGNLFIAWRFGNILSNCLTASNLPMVGAGGDGRRKIIAYRAAAQALMNITVFAHSMGRFESVYIFTRDVMMKLYTMAEVDQRFERSSAEDSTAGRLLQALYTATVVSRNSSGQTVGNTDFGLTLSKAADFFNKSRRNIRLLIKDNEVANPGELKDASGAQLEVDRTVVDNTLIGQAAIKFVTIESEIPLGKLREMVVSSFHYWAMALLDDDYLRCNLIGLASGPHGGQLEKMENSIRNYLGTTRDLYRQQITKEGNTVIPNLISGDDPREGENLEARLDRQLPEGARVVGGDMITFPGRNIRNIRVPGDTLTTFDETTQNKLLQGVQNYDAGMVRAL